MQYLSTQILYHTKNSNLSEQPFNARCLSNHKYFQYLYNQYSTAWFNNFLVWMAGWWMELVVNMRNNHKYIRLNKDGALWLRFNYLLLITRNSIWNIKLLQLGQFQIIESIQFILHWVPVTHSLGAYCFCYILFCFDTKSLKSLTHCS